MNYNHKLKSKDHYEIGEIVHVPKQIGTVTMMVSWGKIENILTTRGGNQIAYVRLNYGKRISQCLPFNIEDLRI
ncbi:MAG: hypothetical protein ABFD50_18995 [Smithella sp.]